MLAPLLALALCVLAALSGTVLMQPVLAGYGLPPGALTLIPPLLFIGLLVPPVFLSGDWLWMNGKRRSGPPRGQILARLAVVSGFVGLLAPLWLTERPVTEIASSVRALPNAWAGQPDEPKVTPPPQVAEAEPAVAKPILPTPIDAQFPTAPIVLEAQPLQVIDAPTAVQLPQALPGTFFVYEWKDPAGATHWCNVFEEIPPDAKIVKATVMKPVEPTAPPAWVVAAAPKRSAPTGLGFMNDPFLPSYAETHWKTQFRQSHRRLTEQQRKIAAKQREIDNAPPLMTRRSLEEELRLLKQGLEDLQREDNDLEREASFRAVPREWRN
jgi:hypothetical protein